MKTRRTLFAATFALITAVVSNTAAANTETAQNPFAAIAKQYVDTAIAETTYELQLNVEKDVLTASHHSAPTIDATTLLASVKITDIEDES